jgi:signal transduction histidine kinase
MQSPSVEVVIFLVVSISVIVLVLVLMITLIFLYHKRQIAYQKNLDTMKFDYETNLLKTQVEIQEQTLQNISRDIHDNLTLSLSLAKLNLNMINWEDIRGAESSVNNTVSLIGNVIISLTDLSKSMNSELITNQGLVMAIEAEMQRIQFSAHIHMHLKVVGDQFFLPCNQELIIFRIIQEAFNNIIKHAAAKKVTLLLEYKPKELYICIKDDGKGFEPELIREKNKGQHAGLINMKTRAKMFNGQFLINSIIDKGTELILTIPINEQDKEKYQNSAYG